MVTLTPRLQAVEAAHDRLGLTYEIVDAINTDGEHATSLPSESRPRDMILSGHVDPVTGALYIKARIPT